MYNFNIFNCDIFHNCFLKTKVFKTLVMIFPQLLKIEIYILIQILNLIIIKMNMQ